MWGKMATSSVRAARRGFGEAGKRLPQFVLAAEEQGCCAARGCAGPNGLQGKWGQLEWRRPTVRSSSKDSDTGTSQTPATAPGTQGLPVPTQVSLFAHLGANAGLAPTPPVLAGIETTEALQAPCKHPGGLADPPAAGQGREGVKKRRHRRRLRARRALLLGLSWPQQEPRVPRPWHGGSSASSHSCWGRQLSPPPAATQSECHQRGQTPQRNPRPRSGLIYAPATLPRSAKPLLIDGGATASHPAPSASSSGSRGRPRATRDPICPRWHRPTEPSPPRGPPRRLWGRASPPEIPAAVPG